MRRPLAVALIAMLLLDPLAAKAPISDATIDRIFAAWARPGSPGCALAVVKNGAVAYARGYGSANLENPEPITSRTVFDIGSVSKQFTAMSIILLAQDGKLALDDDIHATIGELPDYGAPVSLRQMLHHASGLPSYTDLFDLAGVPQTSLTTDADALALIARQTRLDFPPGQQYRYSDTNYFLLSLVVRRVSGETLRAFAQRRIFGPLGMRDTHFHDDHAMIVPRRATGYAPRPDGGFAIDMSNFEELGDGSVMTTVEDLVRWDRNFRDATVGGPQAIADLQQPGLRRDGSATPYAMGLIRDTYRSHARVQHTGEWAGYRAAYLRFPNDRLSVILLCNRVGDLDALGLAERIADRYLAAAPLSPTAAEPEPAAWYAGTYWNGPSLATLRFTPRTGALALVSDDAVQVLRPLGNGSFQGENSSARFVFSQPDDGPMQVQAFSDDGDPVVFQRLPASAAAEAAPRNLAPYAGSYYSEALGVSWTLALAKGELERRQWLFPSQRLRPRFGEVFAGELSEGSYALQFTRDATGAVDGFLVGTSMAGPMRFVRCEPADPAKRGPIGMACAPRQWRAAGQHGD